LAPPTILRRASATDLLPSNGTSPSARITEQNGREKKLNRFNGSPDREESIRTRARMMSFTYEGTQDTQE
jgi:hypothetical protein